MNVLKVSRWTIAAFVLPCLIIYIGIVFVPILVSMYSGMLDWNGIGESTFVGLANFKKLLFHDSVFWPSVRRTLMFAVFSMAEIPIALLVAILLKRYVRKPNFLVSSYFLPVILSVVVVGQLWKTIYNPASMGGMLTKFWMRSDCIPGAKPGSPILRSPCTRCISLPCGSTWVTIP